MTCPYCDGRHFDVPEVDTFALMQRNYRFLLRSVERAMEGKPFQTEEEEEDATKEVRR